MTELVPFLLTWLYLSVGIMMISIVVDTLRETEKFYLIAGTIIGGLMFTLAIATGVQI